MDVLKYIDMLERIKNIINGKVPIGKKRSSQWPKVRKQHLEKNPACAACGSIEKVEVHHKIPFHFDQSKELDLSNLITLCECKKNTGGVNCHLEIGHGDSYRAYVEPVIQMSLKYKTYPKDYKEITAEAKRIRKSSK